MSSYATPSYDPAPTHRDAMRRALVMLFLGGMLVWHTSVFLGSWHQLSQGVSDFVAFYSAGQGVRRGLGAKLYNQQTLTQLQNEVAPRLVARWHGPLPYIHPPFEAVVFAPLAALPYPVAFALWDIVSIATLFVSTLLLSSYLPRLQRWSRALPFLCTFAFLPVLVCLLRGQDSALLFLFVVAAFVAMRHRHGFAAGACLGLALIKFQCVIALMAILLLKRKWNLIAGFCVTALLLTMASAAVVGWDATLHYPHSLILLSQSQAHLTMDPQFMPNLRSAIESLVGSGGIVANGILALVSMALVIFVARRCRLEPEEPAFSLEFSLALTVSLLVSYHLGTQDLILLLLPLLVVSEVLLEHAIERPASYMLLAAVVLMFFSPAFLLLAAVNGLETGYLWTAVLLAAGIAISICQDRSHDPRGSSAPRRARKTDQTAHMSRAD